MTQTFTINEKQWQKYVKWSKKFKFVPLGTIGGSYTFSFTGTSLGTVVKVKNNAFNKELDLTDYTEW